MQNSTVGFLGRSYQHTYRNYKDNNTIYTLMPNCKGDYWPKSGTGLFMFDDVINFWSTIVM